MPRGTDRYDQARLQGRLWTPVGYSNLLLNSEDVSAGVWSKISGATVTADAAVAPDGTLSADQVVLSAGSSGADNAVYQLWSGSLGTVLTGDKFTVAAWMKASSAMSLYMGIQGAASPANNDPSHLSLKSLTTDWFRYWATFTGLALDSGFYITPCASAWYDGTTRQTTSGGTLFIWGIQFTRGTSPGGYLATASATRAAPAGFQDATKDDASEYWRLGLQRQLDATNQFKNRPPLIGD
jgi:hypothetical protein